MTRSWRRGPRRSTLRFPVTTKRSSAVSTTPGSSPRRTPRSKTSACSTITRTAPGPRGASSTHSTSAPAQRRRTTSTCSSRVCSPKPPEASGGCPMPTTTSARAPASSLGVSPRSRPGSPRSTAPVTCFAISALPTATSSIGRSRWMHQQVNLSSCARRRDGPGTPFLPPPSAPPGPAPGGLTLNSFVLGLAATPDNWGYWLVAVRRRHLQLRRRRVLRLGRGAT